MALSSALGFIVLIVALLLLFQRKLIYFPRGYEKSYRLSLPDSVVELECQTSQGRQVAFYLPPPDGAASPPSAVWALLGGNGATALDWIDWLGRAPYHGAGFLLIDYPGYGLCAGKPTEKTILETSEASLQALAVHLNLDRAELASRLGLLGHSIGAGAALRLAAKQPPARIVLVSPFTSLIDMARRSVGWPLCHLLIDRFDNRAHLAELAAQNPRPAITILHGARDEIVPVRMSRRLAAEHPEWIEYQEIPNADHNWILDIAAEQIFEAMGLGKDAD